MAIKRRLEVAGFGAIGIGLTLAMAFYSNGAPFFPATVMRDLLPAPLMLLVYWQAGRFSVTPNEWAQKRLLKLDQISIGQILRSTTRPGIRAWLARYLELSYLLCYPLVPFGIGVLYLAGEPDHVDGYWTVVQASTYLCYLPLPFIQMLPPRLLLSDTEHLGPRYRLRLLNLKILKHASIQVNTFPSAHVASTSAAALALLWWVPAAGAAFALLALSIAGGAVLGRYHYLADVVLGILLALAVYFL
ncbi:MAG TPA: phosphatase PAP2 family protein [Blastocatellia bacterium]|nr:phosphatase PAP2 family protein [Blastocatellia bacterium]